MFQFQKVVIVLHQPKFDVDKISSLKKVSLWIEIDTLCISILSLLEMLCKWFIVSGKKNTCTPENELLSWN